MESRTVLDSGFRTVDSGFRLLDSSLCQWNLDSGFQPIVSGIPDSLYCIPDSKAQDSKFHVYNFPRFRIPKAKIFRNPESLTRGEQEMLSFLQQRKQEVSAIF